jgi:hypothetical protein
VQRVLLLQTITVESNMTYQRDPDQKTPSPLGREPRRNFARREEGSWNFLPLALGALALFVVGYTLLGDHGANRSNTSIDRTTTKTTPN